MGKDVVHTYSAIPLGHKEEWNDAICSNMDGSRDYHTKWITSEKDKYKCITYMWNLKKKWYKWTYLQNRNRLIDLENELNGCRGEGWGEEGMVREFGIKKYTLLYLKQITNKNLLYSTRNFAHVMWQPGWEGSLGEKGYMCMYGRVPSLFTWNYQNIVNQYNINCIPHTISQYKLYSQKLYPNTK